MKIIHKRISSLSTCVCGVIRPTQETAQKWEEVTCLDCIKLVPKVSKKRICQELLTKVSVLNK